MKMPALDTFHGTMAEALVEAQRRKSDPTGKDMVIRVEPSRYGGFRVRSTPSDLYVDQLTDGPFMFGGGVPSHMVGA
jgi:hypothetical protein